MAKKSNKVAFLLIGLLLAAAIAAGGQFVGLWNFSFLQALQEKNAKPSHVTCSAVTSADGKRTQHRLMVDGKPYLVQGACYNPIPIGKDGLYNFWGDPNKPWIADGRLMRAMGVNTVRFYRVGKDPVEVKRVLNDLYFKYGIRSVLGSYLGFWDWPPPNYADEQFRNRVKDEYLEMVKQYKDCPGVLVWVLGNENNYSFDRNIQVWSSEAIEALPTPQSRKNEKARLYYSFVNDLAKEVKKIDPNHPVALGVGETKSLDIAKKECTDVDLIGMIAYRGHGFGNMFRQIREAFDLPVLLIECGADSYNAATRESDEQMQADFVKRQWKEITDNADAAHGTGTCLGALFFEWNDEWWKANENMPPTWYLHDTAGHWQNTSYHVDAYGPEKMNMNEEWWGLVSLNSKKRVNGLDERVPKKAYYTLQTLWTKKAK